MRIGWQRKTSGAGTLIHPKVLFVCYNSSRISISNSKMIDCVEENLFILCEGHMNVLSWSEIDIADPIVIINTPADWNNALPGSHLGQTEMDGRLTTSKNIHSTVPHLINRDNFITFLSSWLWLQPHTYGADICPLIHCLALHCCRNVYVVCPT